MKGRIISPGKAEGVAIVSTEPIGFYGGIDIKTGIVIEKGHPLEGRSVKDKILVFPCGKGSTVGSYVIYGIKKNDVAPAGIINKETETIVATGVILAGIPCIDKIDISKIKTGDKIRIKAGDEDLRFLLISGKPIQEPVAWYGPIVMNTQEELDLAFSEYRNGTFIKA